MTANRNLKQQYKSAAKIPASLAAVVKTDVKRRVKSAEATINNWSTAKKVGVTAAVVAVPIVAAAVIATVISHRRAATALAAETDGTTRAKSLRSGGKRR